MSDDTKPSHILSVHVENEGFLCVCLCDFVCLVKVVKLTNGSQ